jgi:hypothetical protein
MPDIGIKGGSALEAKLKQTLEKISKASKVSVGFLEGSAEPDGTSLPMVAAIQEFGAPGAGIPPRPFFRPMVKTERAHWGADLAARLKATDYDAEASLGQMGKQMEGELRASIVAVSDPPLSPVTLLLRERFGNDPGAIKFKDVQQAREDVASGRVPNVTATQAHPLIWTGHMLNSIKSEVE